MNNLEQNMQNTSKLSCKYCQRAFLARNSLWYHEKKCNIFLEQSSLPDNNNIVINSNEVLVTSEPPHFNAMINLFQEQLQENKELRQLLIEQNKQMMELASKASSITNNTTNNNQQFNLQIFLHEKCKNAMNITDFVDTIKVQLADLEVFGTHGYCEGITRIFVRCLNELDICKRPIHCSDLKREIMYVKDKDVWEKDDDRKLIIKAIDKIERKNHLLIPAWQLENPEFNDYYSKVNDLYNKLLYEAMGGETKEENEKNYNKITRCIAKGTIITKNSL